MSVRSEREKMLAGEVYNCLDAALIAERKAVKELLRRYNLSTTPAERESLLKQLLGDIGEDLIIEPPFYCMYGKNISVGDHVYLNVLCTILDCNQVRIGDYAMIGPHVQIYTPAHELQAERRNRGLEVAKAIVIEENV